MTASPLILAPHHLSIALLQPQIAPNTGNVARLCVATGTALHLVRPMGFILSDRQLKRSAMDYWPRLKLTVHDDTNAFLASMQNTRLILFTSKATRSFWDIPTQEEDCLVFGSETTGLPLSLIAQHPATSVRIPQQPEERCLNLSTSVGIGLYASLAALTHRRDQIISVSME